MKNSSEAAHYQRPHANRFTEATGKRYAGLFPGMHAVVGTPDDVVEELERLKATGIDGSALVFLNYLAEMPFFVRRSCRARSGPAYAIARNCSARYAARARERTGGIGTARR